jgi:hypothetical protein
MILSCLARQNHIACLILNHQTGILNSPSLTLSELKLTIWYIDIDASGAFHKRPIAFAKGGLL